MQWTAEKKIRTTRNEGVKKMKVYVDKQRVLDLMDDYCVMDDLYNAVKELPAENVVTGETAQWVDTGEDYWKRGRTSNRFYCSNCGRRAGEKSIKHYLHCPKCGLLMTGIINPFEKNSKNKR